MTDNIIDEVFDDGDFVFTKKTGSDGNIEILGGGYKIKSAYLQGGMPAMITINNGEFNGGKVSSPFENLAVPAGLFYINMRMPKPNTNKEVEQHYKQHETITDDMIDKLYSLVEVDKKRKRKTRKHFIKTDKPDKIKTRKAK